MSVAEIEAREAQFDSAAGGLWRDAWARLRRNPGALVGFAIVGHLLPRRPLRAAARARGSTRRRSLAPRRQLLPRAVARPLVRNRPARARRALADPLRRPVLAPDRRRLGRRRPLDRDGLRLDRRLRRRGRRQRDHAPDGHHARDPRPAARDRDRRDARPRDLPDHGRGRRDADPDLRPADARLDPRPARQRLRARGALDRRAETLDPRPRTSSRTRSRR